MGANVSKSETAVDNSVLNSITKDFLNSTTLNQEAYTATEASNELEVESMILGGECEVITTNKVKAEQVFNGNMSAESLSDLKTQLKNTVKSEFEKTTQQETGLFPGVNGNYSTTDVDNSIDTIIDETVTNETMTNMTASMFTKVNNKIKIRNLQCFGSAKVEFSNDAVVTQVADMVANSVQTAITSNEVLSDVDSAYKEKHSQLTGSLLPGISTEALVAIMVTVIVIAGIGIAVKVMMSKKSAPTPPPPPPPRR